MESVSNSQLLLPLLFILVSSFANGQIAFDQQQQQQGSGIQFDDVVTNSPPSCQTPDRVSIFFFKIGQTNLVNYNNCH